MLIPETVAAELNQPLTPLPVKDWISQPPCWFEIVPSSQSPDSPALQHLDCSERDVILLALEIDADLVLIDNREGVEEAIGLGLNVTGTPGVPEALARLRVTNFRASSASLDRWLADHE